MLSKAALLAATALPAAYAAVHESLAAAPAGWTQARAASPYEEIQLTVAVAYQNLDQLESQLMSVSTPGSPNYGQYIDLDQQASTFNPSSETVGNVQSWLQANGVTKIVTDGAVVHFASSVGNVNKMLNSNYQWYTNGQQTKLRTLSYSVPDSLQDSVDFLSPSTFFGDTVAQRVIPEPRSGATKTTKRSENSVTKRQLSASCQESITPVCLQELYNVGNYSVDCSAGSDIAFGSFLNQSASYSDLALFEQAFNIPSQNFTVKQLINGGVDNQDPATEMDGEANLDVQNIIGLVDGLPVYEYITGGSPPFIPDLLAPNASANQNEPYLQYYQYLLSQPNSNLPHVITNSYGDHENTVPPKYANRVCKMIGMMGLRGITILESSGDEGTGAVCLTNDGTNKPQFTPQFPGTCPYVTAVGGTQFLSPEAAWNASSGGFSNYFPTAWYQQDAVNYYLDNGISADTKNYYSSNQYANFSGRGFPDVSAHSLYPDYVTYINGTAEPNGGTSAASPVVAAIIALLNDARFRANKPAMGFLNPWLYTYAANSSALNDIVDGGSLGCLGFDLQNGDQIPGAGVIPYASWNATAGWDPVTGLGTPNFQNLLTIAL